MGAVHLPYAMPRKNAVEDKANHWIADSLTLLTNMVRMQATAAGKRERPPSALEVRLMLEGIAARIGAIGQLHRLLAQIPTDEVTSLRPHLRQVTDTLVAALSSPGQRLSVTHGGSDCLVLARHVAPIILILCEIFINAIKDSRPAGLPLVIAVDCIPAADGRLVILVSDDGVGLYAGLDPHKGHGSGLGIMRSLASELGASLDVESTGLGVVFRLSFPVGMTAGAKLV